MISEKPCVAGKITSFAYCLHEVSEASWTFVVVISLVHPCTCNTFSV